MKEIFGLETSTLMVGLLAVFACAVIAVGAIAIGNRTMFKLGLRNLPRRGVQTALVVLGLMLSTLIITAAFTTGDTVDRSLTNGSYEIFQRSDLDIAFNGERDFSSDRGGVVQGSQTYVPVSAVQALEQRFANDPDIEGFLPFLLERATATNEATGLSQPAVQLAGIDAARLESLGSLRAADGNRVALTSLGPNDVLVSEWAARDLDATAGHTLALYIGGRAHQFHVAGIVENELASGVLGMTYSDVPGGIAVPLSTLQQLTDHEGEVNMITVALQGGVRGSLDAAPAAKARLDAYLGSAEGQQVMDLNDPDLAAAPIKFDAVRDAEQSGQEFTTIFLVLGLFSIAAGVMLIFMIFVMLAAERKAEMGMARAVGAQRKHLVQSFVAEGMAYSLLAGVAGAALGVLASFGMTVGLLKATGGSSFSVLEPHVTSTSVIIGYTLGVAVTFITVLFASLKVSHVNIVAAIRGLAEERGSERKRSTSWRWVLLGIPALILTPLGLWLVLRKGLGLPWAWITGPVGIVLGLLLMQLGSSNGTLFFFAAGISLLPLSGAVIARHLGAPNRPTWTIVGVLLTAYWVMPPSLHDRLFGTFDFDIEMFVLSGIMLVVSLTLVIVFNARLLTALFERGGLTSVRAYRPAAVLGGLAGASVTAGLAAGSGGDGLGQLAYLAGGLLAFTAGLSFISVRFPQVAPALKMAIAYPLANRFRTGMTVAMFSLIVFSLTVFSILVANFAVLEGGDEARGNLDVVVDLNAGSPIDDLGAALAGDPAAGAIAATGRVTVTSSGQQVHEAGESGWQAYGVLGADEAFFSELDATLEARASGYESTEAVMQAVRTDPSLALIDMYATDKNDTQTDFKPEGAKISDQRFEPFQVEVRNRLTGETATVTVVGVLRAKLGAQDFAGVYVNEQAYRGLFGEPDFQRAYLRLHEGADAGEVARAVESALALDGVQARSIEQMLDDRQAENRTFQRMFQAFMALGLVVGVAGLGVISFRSVVERRQQIGMLRAIGYQRETVTLTFLLEASFVAVVGILSGVVGGAVIARNLLTSDSLTSGASVGFAVPWVEIVLMVGAAYLFSLAMTWWPSRGAGRVPVAAALRYE